MTMFVGAKAREDTKNTTRKHRFFSRYSETCVWKSFGEKVPFHTVRNDERIQEVRDYKGM